MFKRFSGIVVMTLAFTLSGCGSEAPKPVAPNSRKQEDPEAIKKKMRESLEKGGVQEQVPQGSAPGEKKPDEENK